jgi:hypothetical protein
MDSSHTLELPYQISYGLTTTCTITGIKEDAKKVEDYAEQDIKSGERW